MSALARMQVMYMLEYEIKCSSNTVFLIALADASMQCLSNWWWWWSSKHLFLCVHFKTSSFARDKMKRGRLYKDEWLTSFFSLSPSPPKVIQLTWLSKLGEGWKEYLHSFYNSRMRNRAVQYSLMYHSLGPYCLTLHINCRQGKTEGPEVYK